MKTIMKIDYRIETVCPRATIEIQDSVTEPMTLEQRDFVEQAKNNVAGNKCFVGGLFHGALAISFSQTVSHD